MGSGVAGVLLVILASWFGPRAWIGPRRAVVDALAMGDEPVKVVPPETRSRWGMISLAIGVTTLPMSFLVIMGSINYLRKSYFPTTGVAVCALAYACGIAAACIANWRNERGFVRTSLGLLVNACALAFLYWMWREWS